MNVFICLKFSQLKHPDGLLYTIIPCVKKLIGKLFGSVGQRYATNDNGSGNANAGKPIELRHIVGHNIEWFYPLITPLVQYAQYNRPLPVNRINVENWD